MKYRLKAASGPMTGRTFDLGDTTVVGSGPQADITLDGLDGAHARIVRRDGGLVVEAEAETRVNGATVEAQGLQSGDELQFGTYRFVLQAPGLKPTRVLDQVPQRRTGARGWLIAAALAAAAGGAAWWFLLGPGAGA